MNIKDKCNKMGDNKQLRHAISAIVFKENKFLMVAGKDWPKGAWCFP